MDDHVKTTDQKFNNSGIMTNAKPIAAQTGESFPMPDPAPKIPWTKSRFEFDSSNPGKGGEK